MKNDNSPATGEATALPFQSGDTVRCIDITAAFNRLTLGGSYVVGEAYDGTPAVIINGNAMCMDRFERVAKEGQP